MQSLRTNYSQKIKEQIRKQLLPRPDRFKKMKLLGLVPESNQQTIIIPCLQKTFGFKTNMYGINKNYLESSISRLDFNGFIRKCNKIVEEVIVRKTKKENQAFFGIISTLLKISIVIALMTFFLMAAIVFFQLEENTFNTILILAGFLLASASMIAVVCPIVLYHSEYEAVSYEQEIKTQLQTLSISQNLSLQISNKKHLSWKIERNFFWIELHIDYSLYENANDKEDNQKNFVPSQILEITGNYFLKRKFKSRESNFRKEPAFDTD